MDPMDLTSSLPALSRLGLWRFTRLNDAGWTLDGCEPGPGADAHPLLRLFGNAAFGALLDATRREQLHQQVRQQLAERGHYPAIDIAQSISRCMALVTSHEHQKAARSLKALAARHAQVRELLPLGAYVPGADPQTDRAVNLYPRVEAFLHQGTHEAAPLAPAVAQLEELTA